MAAAAMLSVFAEVGWGQAAAQPKPLVNADIVKMVKAGLAENTIVLAIQNDTRVSRHQPGRTGV